MQWRDGKSEPRSFAPALALLFAAVVVNYVDRGNLSIAAPLLKEEWHISPSQLGVVFSAFFWTYTVMQLGSGWLVDRFDVNKVMAAGFLLWSVATAATGLVPGLALLFVMRLLLGIGESVVFPASSKILALYLPEDSRGFANGLLCAAMLFGAVAGSYGGGMLMARYGWRPIFIGFGLTSLLWLPAWRRWQPRAREATEAEPMLPVPRIIQVLGKRSFWGVSVGAFSNTYLLYLMVLWLPYYLVRERHLTMAGMSKIASVYYLSSAVASVMTGLLADRWIRRGGAPGVVRKSAMALGCTIAALSLGLWAGADQQTYLYCLLATGVGAGIAGSGNFAFGQTLAGPQGAGRWIGMQNAVSNMSGVIGPALTGFLVQRTGHFSAAFAIAAAVTIAGGLAWVFGTGRLVALNWTAGEAVPVAAAVVPAAEPL